MLELRCVILYVFSVVSLLQPWGDLRVWKGLYPCIDPARRRFRWIEAWLILRSISFKRDFDISLYSDVFISKIMLILRGKLSTMLTCLLYGRMIGLWLMPRHSIQPPMPLSHASYFLLELDHPQASDNVLPPALPAIPHTNHIRTYLKSTTTISFVTSRHLQLLFDKHFSVFRPVVLLSLSPDISWHESRRFCPFELSVSLLAQHNILTHAPRQLSYCRPRTTSRKHLSSK